MRALSDGESIAEQELGDLRDEAFGVVRVVPEDVLGNGGIADDDEVTGAGGEAVNGTILDHPFVKGEEECAAEEVRDVVEAGVGDGDSRVVG